jgi:uncharacterized membrane protein YgcG
MSGPVQPVRQFSSLIQTMAALMAVTVMAVLILALAAAPAELVAVLILVLVMVVLILVLAVVQAAELVAVLDLTAVTIPHAQGRSVRRTGISPANAPWKPLCRDSPTVFSRPLLSRLPTAFLL